MNGEIISQLAYHEEEGLLLLARDKLSSLREALVNSPEIASLYREIKSLNRERLSEEDKQLLDDFIFEKELIDWYGKEKNATAFQRIRQAKQKGSFRLFLSFSHLHSIPTCIEYLDRLQELHLGHNQLSEIPKEIGNLSALQELFLSHNQLSEIPSELGNLFELKILLLSHNPLSKIPCELENLHNLQHLQFSYTSLDELPLSLANLEKLNRLAYEGLSDELQSQARQILTSCQAKRARQASAKIEDRLALWKSYTKGFSLDEKALVASLSERERSSINEWLIRLSRTKDFARNQKDLASFTCKMLQSLVSHPDFKEGFFAGLESNLEDCEDRSAMSFNELYSFWQISVNSRDYSPKKQLEILSSVAKAATLRLEIAKLLEEKEKNLKHIERESVEIYLYYELQLRKELELDLPMKNSSHASDIGKREWIDPARLKKTVLENHLKQVLKLAALEKILEKNSDYKAKRELILEENHEKLSRIDKEVHSQEYKLESDKISSNYEQEINALKLKVIKTLTTT